MNGREMRNKMPRKSLETFSRKSLKAIRMVEEAGRKKGMQLGDPVHNDARKRTNEKDEKRP